MNNQTMIQRRWHKGIKRLLRRQLHISEYSRNFGKLSFTLWTRVIGTVTQLTLGIRCFFFNFSEYLAAESNEKFWKFVDSCQDKSFSHDLGNEWLFSFGVIIVWSIPRSYNQYHDNKRVRFLIFQFNSWCYFIDLIMH